ncbi:MAG: prepilin peptidase [Chloroflexota bacterium]
MEAVLTILFILGGIAIGSFLNVLIDRLPAGESIAYPPSHCADCQHKLAPWDLIPIFSYLWLRGRCRYCRAQIPLRLPLIEAGTGLLFWLAFWRYGLSAEFALTALYTGVFIIIIFIDMERQLILNKVLYPAALFTVLLYLADIWLPAPGLFPAFRYLPAIKVVSSLIGGVTGFLFFFIVYVLARGGMGAGDVKLAGFIGLVAGFPLVFPALFIGIVAGGLVAIIFLLLRKKGRKEVLPYGAFLGIGPIITLLWGQAIMDWYLHLF